MFFILPQIQFSYWWNYIDFINLVWGRNSLYNNVISHCIGIKFDYSGDAEKKRPKSNEQIRKETNKERRKIKICIFRTTGPVRLSKQYHDKCQLEKCSMWESCVKFDLGQNEAAAQKTAPEVIGRCCWQEAGGRSECTWLWWTESTWNQAVFLQKVSASHVKLLLVMRHHPTMKGYPVLF